MKKETFIKNAYYEGGKKAMDEFIQKNIKYPQEALDKKIEGKVHLFMDIDSKGRVHRVKVVSGIGHGCDDEAVRIVKKMIWKVDKVRNMHVIYHHRLTINFRLPTAQQANSIRLEEAESMGNNEPLTTQSNFSIQYTIVAKAEVKKTAEKKQEKVPQVVYNYSI